MYQLGGTAVSVWNKCLSKGSDRFGTTQVMFISAYCVCDGAAASSAVTSRTVQPQQEWMYASLGHAYVNLREQFVTDISALINDLQDQGHDIQLSMDANEASGPGSGVNRIVRNCYLVDAHSLCTSDSSPTRPQEDRFCSSFTTVG
jgi:hypothetical protein